MANIETYDPRARDMQLSLKIPSYLMTALMMASNKQFSNVSAVARAAIANEMKRQGFLDDGK
jgi:hypothetical protein